jgi:hypothetical protein
MFDVRISNIENFDIYSKVTPGGIGNHHFFVDTATFDPDRKLALKIRGVVDLFTRGYLFQNVLSIRYG